MLALAIFVVVHGAEMSSVIRADLLLLQDTTAQIRIRAAVLLLIGFAAIAEQLGLEAILGAFIAGAIVSIADRDERLTHPDFQRKLEAIGFGVFIPVFFVTTGVKFDLDALLADASNLAMVPIFLAALVIVRGLPALIYRRALDNRQTAIAGLLQATSSWRPAPSGWSSTWSRQPRVRRSSPPGSSVLLFPLTGLALLGRDEDAEGGEAEPGPAPTVAM